MEKETEIEIVIQNEWQRIEYSSLRSEILDRKKTQNHFFVLSLGILSFTLPYVLKNNSETVRLMLFCYPVLATAFIIAWYQEHYKIMQIAEYLKLKYEVKGKIDYGWQNVHLNQKTDFEKASSFTVPAIMFTITFIIPIGLFIYKSIMYCDPSDIIFYLEIAILLVILSVFFHKLRRLKWKDISELRSKLNV